MQIQNTSLIQRALIQVFYCFKTWGILQLPLVRHLYRFSYFAYKSLWEDPHATLCHRHPEIFRRGHAIDVGANIGYTSWRFAKALRGSPWRVFAFEPEPANLRILNETLASLNVADRVEVRAAAVSDHSGRGQLVVSAAHPGDHHLDWQQGKHPTIDVEMLSLDDFLASRGLRPQDIGFIKIDVQGAEPLVFRGMRRLIEGNQHLSLSMELSPASLIEGGVNPEEFIKEIVASGLSMIYRIQARKVPLLMSVESILEVASRQSYCDLLFVRPKYPL